MRSLIVGLVVVSAMVVTACGGAGTPDESNADSGVRVASFDFDESVLVAEIYAQALESEDITVVRLGALGPREIVAPAMEMDAIDVVPEYLGTLLSYSGATQVSADPEFALPDLNARLAPRGLRALTPSPAEDKNVFVVTTETAEREGLVDISDLASVSEAMMFGGPAECRDRALCLLGLEEVYGLSFAGFVTQPSLAFTGEALRRDEIGIGLMFSTSPELEDPALVELNDDLGLQPAENVVPVVRVDAIERWGPELVASLDLVSATLTTGRLRALNRRVADGEMIADIAEGWLSDNGLVDSG